MRASRFRLALATALFWYAASASAIFSDDEARKGVADLKKQVERLEAQAADRRAVQELAGSLDQIRQDLARLRGQIEELSYKIDNLDKRQKDLYVDLDNRMRKLEAVEKEKEKAVQAAAAEQQSYDAVLNQFKAGNYGASIQGFQGFLQQYPQSKLAPSAQYWIGNAHYAMRDYKSAVVAQQKVIDTWPTDPKAADAMLNLASSQAELGDLNASRITLKALVQKYPNSPAAEQAKQRLARAGVK
ncbi:MAG: tol-pal system protein YbgF [Burkholderiales bacterium]|jgi:tol-pal system protein YbgF|nr:tol-pal system protein YbgF [Burkholderiales bacterium]